MRVCNDLDCHWVERLMSKGGDLAMNAPSLDELRTKKVTDGLEEEKMEQIRQLLLGDHLAHAESRINGLEKRISDLELRIQQRFDAIAARIEALGGEMESDRRASFDELSRAVQDLGQDIKKLGRG